MKAAFIPFLWVLFYQCVGGLIGFVTARNIDGWYDALEKPALNPPDIAFGIVWPILYVMIALAGWLSWCHRAQSQGPLLVFAVYSLMNWGWSFVFFAAHEILLGFVWIAVLNVISLIFIALIWKNNRKAAFLMVLPTVWTFFAMYLNYSLWILNS